MAAILQFRRIRWRPLLALAGVGLLSGCYYPSGYYPGYPPYGYSYPYSAGTPYPPAPPPAGPPSPLNPMTQAPPPPNAPVERAPLPPPAQ
jgi:hypothetical protein